MKRLFLLDVDTKAEFVDLTMRLKADASRGSLKIESSGDTKEPIRLTFGSSVEPGDPRQTHVVFRPIDGSGEGVIEHRPVPTPAAAMASLDEPLTAHAYGFVRGVLEDLAAGRPRSIREAAEALRELDIVKARHQRYLDACARATDLANRWHGTPDDSTDLRYASEHAAELRRVLRDGYLGGPLL